MGKKYKIQKDVAGIFKHYKKYIPCFNRACLAAPSCCTVKKASKKAKYLAYTITLKEPCIEAYKIFSIITSISEYNKLIQQHINKLQKDVYLIEMWVNRINGSITTLERTCVYDIEKRMATLETPN